MKHYTYYCGLRIVNCGLKSQSLRNPQSAIRNPQCLSGFSIVEYLILAATLIGALVAFAPRLRSNLEIISMTAYNKFAVTQGSELSVVDYLKFGIPQNPAKRKDIP